MVWFQQLRMNAIQPLPMRHVVDILFAALLFTIAVIAIVRPVVSVRWARRAHPQLAEDDQSVLWIARLVGIGGLGVTAFFCMIIFRSLF
jgi:hypothetical protein